MALSHAIEIASSMPVFGKISQRILSINVANVVRRQEVSNSNNVPKVPFELVETSFVSAKSRGREVTAGLLPGVSVLTMRAGKDTSYEDRKCQIATTSPRFHGGWL